MFQSIRKTTLNSRYWTACNIRFFSTTHNKQDTAKDFINFMKDENFGEVLKLCSPQLRKAFPSEVSVNRLWGDFKGLYGDVNNFEFLKEDKNNVLFSCETDNSKLTFIVSVEDNESKVTSFEIFDDGVIENVDKFPPYSSEDAIQEINLSFGKRDWRLPGTLTLPKFASIDSPCQAVVVCIHDFGPSDRDGFFGANAPFRDIAYGLAARGIATFRFDKRTFTYADRCRQSYGGFTPEFEVIEDAMSAIRQASDLPIVKKDSVFVLGLGQGAYFTPKIAQAIRAAEANERKMAAHFDSNESPIAQTCQTANPFTLKNSNDNQTLNINASVTNTGDPLLGATNSSVKGVILMSAPAFPLPTNKIMQIEHVSKCLLKDDPCLKEEIQSLIEETHAQAKNVDRLLTGEQVDADAGFPLNYPSNYWTALEKYDPPETLQQISAAVPSLIVQGGRDYCATEKQDLQVWKNVVPSAEIATFPKLSRTFVQPTEEIMGLDVDGMAHPKEIFGLKGFVAQEVVDKVAMWINKQTSK